MSKKSVIERVQEMTRQALERQAEQLFAMATVRSRISDAAGEGFTFLAIGPDKGVDLSQTDSGKAVAQALREDGFKIEWEKRQHPDGRSSQMLVIRWST